MNVDMATLNLIVAAPNGVPYYDEKPFKDVAACEAYMAEFLIDASASKTSYRCEKHMQIDTNIYKVDSTSAG
jgi:hypothetical protein